MPPPTYASFKSKWASMRSTFESLSQQAAAIKGTPEQKGNLAKSQLLILEKKYEKALIQLDVYQSASAPIQGLEDEELQAAIKKVESAYDAIFQVLNSMTQSASSVADQSTQRPFHGFSSHENSGMIPENTLVNLPRLQIPTFSGQSKDWEQFFSRFDSLIGASSVISDVQKFQYLLESLEPKSKNLVSHLSLTSANYLLAIKLLKEKYDNPRRVLAHHATEFLNIGIATEGNRDSISQFLDCMHSHFQAIEAMEGVDPYQVIVHAFLLSRFDKRLLSQFNPSLEGTVAFPSMEHISRFLNQRLLQWENTDLLSNVHWHTSASGSKPRSRAHALISTPTKPHRVEAARENTLCSCCKEDYHKLYYCPVFRNMTIFDRGQFVKSSRDHCYNCLGLHMVSECTSVSKCQYCGGNHHSMLHWTSSRPTTSKSLPDQAYNKKDTKPISKNPVTSPPGALCAITPHNSCVLLATCAIWLESPNGQVIRLRAVIDTAAAASFIRSDCVNQLKISVRPVVTPLGGLGRSKCQSTGIIKANVKSKEGRVILRNQAFYILNTLTFDTPTKHISASFRKQLISHELADPHFDIPSSLDCILGADAAALVITGSPTSMGRTLPSLLPTKFGDVLLGQAPVRPEVRAKNIACISTPLLALVASPPDTASLNSLIEKFWKTEEPPAPKVELSIDEESCERFYQNTTTRNERGEYEVRLPFIGPCPELGNSFAHTHARFMALERRFAKDPEHHRKYCEFMRDYRNQGHMVPTTGPHYYFIPHHGIYKKRGDISKLRVVFNASALTQKGVSLNDVLFSGPKLHSLIPDVLTLFRLFPLVFTCDIKQMFRAIRIHPDDYGYQCILWRESPQEPLQIYSLTTVTYGTRSAPYLANRTIKQLALDEAGRFPLAAKALQNHIFVDDIAIGAYTLNEAKNLQVELQLLLRSGGFVLSKWHSNCPQLLSSVNTEVQDQLSTSVLGMIWHTKSDMLAINSSITLPEKPPTKRLALSIVAQIFDPCGWNTPFVFRAKAFIQNLWANKLDWDAPLPGKLLPMWNILLDDLPHLSICKILRPFPSGKSLQNYLLHGFCDASQQGSAAVLYLVSVETGEASLVAAKSRIAPLQTQTIPRLELMGAHLLAQLLCHYYHLLSDHLNICNTFLWCDSQIVLNWLYTSPHKLKTFEANRVSQIQSWTGNFSWSYVPSAQNPADLATRGASVKEVAVNPLWNQGPVWISKPSEEWPQHPFIVCQITSGEVSQEVVPPLNSKIKSTILSFEKFSTWLQVIFTFQWVLAWSNTSLPSYPKIVRALCHAVQGEVFQSEISMLKKGGFLPLRFRRLDPFLDSSGLIRVGGRLQHCHALVSPHPIILPNHHHLVTLLINHYHTSLLHAGCATVLAQLRHWFWILGGRQAVRSVLSKCIVCFRSRPRQDLPKMGNLPTNRVNIELPFLNTGMDFAGPFLVKSSHLRKSPVLKVYVCIFICFATTAVHLEVATGLSASEFLDTLKRFISRRGTPKILYSDCGTNFVGAASQLKKLLTDVLHEKNFTQIMRQFALQNNISFHFNPPAAPHQGGLWERAIGSMKKFMLKGLRNETPSMAVFISFVTQVEGILNSRPLTPMSADPRDLEALTPSHFLLGRSISGLPETELHALSCNVKGYHLLRTYLSSFWSQWRTEYLPQLQTRSKWTSQGRNLEVGDLVVLAEVGVASCHWPLGRLSQVFPGKDGIVRRVLVRTASGEYLRPATKIFKLPLY